MHEPRIFLRGYGPRSPRMRLLKAIACFGLSLAAFGLLFLAGRAALQAVLRHRVGPDAEKPPELVLPLSIEVSPAKAHRYTLLTVSVRFVDPQGRPVLDPSKRPKVVIKHDHERVETIGNRDEVVLHADKSEGVWRGCFPLPWDAPTGSYRVCATAELDPQAWVWDVREKKRVTPLLGIELPGMDKEKQKKKIPEGTAYAVASAYFEVDAPPAPPMVPGFCITTLETTTDLEQVRIKRPDGRMGDWRALLDWAEFMDADALFYLGGQTASYGRPLPASQPWVPANIRMMPKLGQEAHRRGLQFGAWIAAYMTWYGSERDKPKYYRYSVDYSRSTGKVIPQDYVSLLDRKRIKDIVALMQQMQNDPNVDYIGLDYIRTKENRCYELTNLFAQEMRPEQLPADWNRRSDKQRMAWLAQRIEPLDKDEDLYEEWNWWRAYRTALVVEQLKRESKITKPLFLFILSWHRGEQHGQDPFMLTDAGADFLNIMLYQTLNREHFDVIMDKWHEYTHQREINAVPGDQADTDWHRERGPGKSGELPVPAPEELYRRMVVAQERLHADGPVRGAFFHDLGRITLMGNIAPYPGKEWAIAGAAAFSTLRNRWHRLPVVVSVNAPPQAKLGGTFPVTVTAQSRSDKPVRGVVVTLYDTDGTQPVGRSTVNIGTLEPGERRIVNFVVRLGGPQPDRQNKFMVAARAKWTPLPTPKPRRDTPRIGTLRPPKQCVAFDYVRGI